MLRPSRRRGHLARSSPRTRLGPLSVINRLQIRQSPRPRAIGRLAIDRAVNAIIVVINADRVRTRAGHPIALLSNRQTCGGRSRKTIVGGVRHSRKVAMSASPSRVVSNEAAIRVGAGVRIDEDAGPVVAAEAARVNDGSRHPSSARHPWLR